VEHPETVPETRPKLKLETATLFLSSKNLPEETAEAEKYLHPLAPSPRIYWQQIKQVPPLVEKQMLRFPSNDSPNDSLDAEARQDAQLMAAVAKGNRKALAELYQRRAPVIYSLLTRMLGNKTEAQDAMQETFLAIWKRAHAFDPVRSSPLSWMVMIARGKAIDLLRSRSRRAARHASYEQEIASLELQVASQKIAEPDDLASACASALHNLPDEQSQALQLAFFRGWSHQEIAGAVNEPLGTIKARIRRGLLAMRRALKDYHA